MDTLGTLGSAMGLGLLAGIRLYATVFALGLAIRMDWFHLSSSMGDLQAIASTPILIASGVACLLEFLADKVPWVDSIWDAFHTFIRPIGAALLGATALGSFEPTTRVLLALLCGGIAFTGHSSKAATRLAANHSPEPFTNIGLSVAEDLLIPAGVWVAMEHPAIALSCVAVFLGIFAWLSPKVFRLLTVSITALRAVCLRWFGQSSKVIGMMPEHPAIGERIRHELGTRSLQPLPANLLSELQSEYPSSTVVAGLHCAARTGGFKNSTGYLCVLPDRFVFVTRRLFRNRTQAIKLDEVRHLRLQPGILLDRLAIGTVSGAEMLFDLFQAAKVSEASRSKTAVPTYPAGSMPV